MRFQQLNRSDADKVFIICKNVSGATVSAGGAVYFDTADSTDGHAVSGARTNQSFLFAGIAKSSMADDAIDEVQVYGVASAYCVLATTTSAAAIGEQLIAVTSQTYLKQYASTDVFTATSSAAWLGGSPFNFVTLMETFASAASAQSTPALKKVFVRAL